MNNKESKSEELNNEKPKVGLVILAFDNVDFFSRAVKSIFANTDYENFELIAVHNPCEDEEINQKILAELSIFRNDYEKFSYIINETNLYHGPGSMKGVNLLSSECKYVALLNDDIFIPGNQLDWLSKMVTFMEENPKAATVTPSLYHMKESLYWCGRTPGKAEHMYLHLPKGDSRIPTKPFTTESNNMAICLTRKNLLDEFSLSDEGVPTHYGSDEAYYNRIQRKYPEYEHWVIPEIKLYHENIYAIRTNRGKDKKVEG